jgi:LacI family transcriptional regulator
VTIPDASVSLADVARRAGVSPSTASKALNARTDVNEATRARVEDTARELGYIPNGLARGLLGAKTGTVGVVTSDLEGRFALPVLMGVEDALGMDRILTFLCDARGDGVREQNLVATLLARRVDGLILVGRQADPRESLGELPVPVVYAYAESDDPDDMSVTVDNVGVGRTATSHLVGIGCRRIVHISGEPDHGAAQERMTGAIEALDAAGLVFATEPLFGDWTEGWGRAAADLVLDRAPDVDGIVCASDQIARGVLETLHERGIAVPGRVAVIGVDNWTALAENSRPALTTVDLQLAQLGRIAAQRLLRASVGERIPGPQRVAGSLTIRDSTVRRR